MLTCPMCKKTVPRLDKQCPTCRTDLSLLVDYVVHLQDGLQHAEALTRAGELGEAVWTYLGVLEIDPDNVTARRQVGQVVAAVRHFDADIPGRRWLKRLRKQAKFRHWTSSWTTDYSGASWLNMLLLFLLVLGALILGYALGSSAGRAGPAVDIPTENTPE